VVLDKLIHCCSADVTDANRILRDKGSLADESIPYRIQEMNCKILTYSDE